jgi:hypothetical protein
MAKKKDSHFSIFQMERTKIVFFCFWFLSHQHPKHQNAFWKKCPVEGGKTKMIFFKKATQKNQTGNKKSEFDFRINFQQNTTPQFFNQKTKLKDINGAPRCCPFPMHAGRRKRTPAFLV